MAETKQASFKDLNFDEIVSSSEFKDEKIVPKKRLSNAIRVFVYGAIGIGLGIGIFFILYYFCIK